MKKPSKNTKIKRVSKELNIPIPEARKLLRLQNYEMNSGCQSCFIKGLEELDMSTGGIKRDDELLVIFARTNNPKSWLTKEV